MTKVGLPLFILLAIAGGASCGGSSSGERIYDNNDLQLLTSYAAKEICSCVFVMGRDEDFCGRWAKAAPNLKTFRVNRSDATVETQAVLFWSAKARYTGRRHGCVLE
jgi:hypothetical protein